MIDIPKLYVGCTEVIELSSGTAVRITLERDDCTGEPRKEYDCYGEVAYWAARDVVTVPMVSP